MDKSQQFPAAHSIKPVTWLVVYQPLTLIKLDIFFTPSRPNSLHLDKTLNTGKHWNIVKSIEKTSRLKSTTQSTAQPLQIGNTSLCSRKFLKLNLISSQGPNNTRNGSDYWFQGTADLGVDHSATEKELREDCSDPRKRNLFDKQAGGANSVTDRWPIERNRDGSADPRVRVDTDGRHTSKTSAGLWFPEIFHRAMFEKIHRKIWRCEMFENVLSSNARLKFNEDFCCRFRSPWLRDKCFSSGFSTPSPSFDMTSRRLQWAVFA